MLVVYVFINLKPRMTSNQKKGDIHTMKTNITHAAIIFADVPCIEFNVHQHHGLHPYLVLSNQKACLHSPVLQVIPMSSNTNRRLPVQVEVHADCFSRRTFALAEQLTLLPREILEQGKYCGQLSEESMARVRQAIKLQLSLD